MKIHFITTESGKEKQLFNEDWAIVRVGMLIKANGKKYTVTKLTWIDSNRNDLKADCVPFSHPYTKKVLKNKIR